MERGHTKELRILGFVAALLISFYISQIVNFIFLNATYAIIAFIIPLPFAIYLVDREVRNIFK